jgi:hypothetical protein
MENNDPSFTTGPGNRILNTLGHAGAGGVIILKIITVAPE